MKDAQPETSSSADPSEVARVTPDELVNRNAAGAAPGPDAAPVKPGQDRGVVVRHVIGGGADPADGA